MIVEGLEEQRRGERRRIVGRVTFEGSPPETHEIHVERPDPGAGRDAPPLADPFFPPLFVAAMALGEDLEVRAPLSPALVAAATGPLAERLLAWHPRLRRATVRAEPGAEAAAPPDAWTAALFSAGVDSWHTFLARRDVVDALVHIRGFEIPYEHEAAWQSVHAHVRRIGEARGVAVIPVETNLLAVGLLAVGARLRAQGRPWRTFGTDAWYGSLLVGVGLALRPRVGRLFVPGSWSVAVDYPVASHPLMEPAWSTPSLAFELDGFDDDRMDKVRHLVREAPEAVPDLRVCIDTSGRVLARLNCGRCIKCVRLMMELRVAGAPPDVIAGLFEARVDLKRAMRRRFHVDPAIWGALEAEAARVGDREIVRAIRVMKDERFYLPRRWRDLRLALRRRLGRS